MSSENNVSLGKTPLKSKNTLPNSRTKKYSNRGECSSLANEAWFCNIHYLFESTFYYLPLANHYSDTIGLYYILSDTTYKGYPKLVL